MFFLSRLVGAPKTQRKSEKGDYWDLDVLSLVGAWEGLGGVRGVGFFGPFLGVWGCGGGRGLVGSGFASYGWLLEQNVSSLEPSLRPPLEHTKKHMFRVWSTPKLKYSEYLQKIYTKAQILRVPAIFVTCEKSKTTLEREPRLLLCSASPTGSRNSSRNFWFSSSATCWSNSS